MTSSPHISTVKAGPHRGARGFTMIELVIVLVVIAIITTLAYPSMQSIMHRKADLDVAAQLVELGNKTRAQAMRRNRAYGLTVSSLNAAEPRGLVEVTESITNLCEHLSDPTKRGLVLSLPLGRVELENVRSPKEKNVGLSGWRRGSQGPLSVEVLELCFTPVGSLYLYNGVNYTPLTGVLELGVQPFSGDESWVTFGPPRLIELTFASGARITQR